MINPRKQYNKGQNFSVIMFNPSIKTINEENHGTIKTIKWTKGHSLETLANNVWGTPHIPLLQHAF